MEKELRHLTSEVRFNQDKGIIEGYALLFDTPSTGLPFTEIIAKGAVTEEVIKNSDVLAVIDHNTSKGVLARSRFGKGSLHLEIDDRGLKYWFKAGKSPIHQELLENLERDEINASSFSFIVGEDEWIEEGGELKRIIRSFKELFDVSPVYFPAYSQTTVSVRCSEMLQQHRQKAENRTEEKPTDQKPAEPPVKGLPEEEGKKADLQNYYRGLKEELKEYLE